MTQLTRTTHTQPLLSRRSLNLLAVAIIIFLGAAGYRLGIDWVKTQQPLARQATTAVEMVDQAQLRVQRRPESAAAYAQLGLALLQQVRETNDTTLYARAQQAFDAALNRDAQQGDALVGRGMLALALHDFRGALTWAEKILAANPYRAAGLGIRVDAQVELGQYEEAVASLQAMVNLRPDLESYSRVSYVRELHGDVDGATKAMRMAVDSALPGSEPWLWTLTHLGHLYWNRGDLDSAEQIYRQVLQQRRDYPFAQAGLARVQAARGNRTAAIALLAPLAERLPLPEFLVSLGELYDVTGQRNLATAQYDLVGVIQQLNAAAGMNVDLELATFDVTHGTDAAGALAAARAAYAERPTIYAADTLAWALYRNGAYTEAQRHSQEALRLGIQDALLHYHAGMIAAALGDKALARQHLETARNINPYWNSMSLLSHCAPILP